MRKSQFFCIFLFLTVFISSVFAKNQKNSYERLDGSWELFLNKSPQQVIHAREKGIKPDCYISVPGFWNDAVEEYLDDSDPKIYGCYRYVMKGLASNTKYAFLMKDSPATSCAVYINGERVTQVGDPYYVLMKNQNKLLKESFSHSQSKPLYGEFYSDEKGKAEIIVFITNYFYRKSGIWDSIFVGPYQSIRRLNSIMISFYTSMAGILAFIGLLNIIQFFISKRKKQYLYLGLTAICFGLRIITAAYCSFGIIFPNIPSEFKFKIEYLVLWVCPICILQQLYELYPSDTDYLWFKWLKKSVIRVVCCLPSFLLGIASLVLPIVYGNKLVPYFQMCLGIISVYIMVKIVKEIIKRKKHIIFYFVSCGTLIFGGFLEIFYTNTRTVLPMSFFPFFLVVFVFIQLQLLAVYQNDAYKDTLKISDDLQKLNEAYLRFVPKEFIKLLDKESVTKIKLGDFSRIEMSIMFSKVIIQSPKEELTPEIQFNLFNEYLQNISKTIRQNSGFVSKFLSSGFMALFPKEDDSLKTAVLIVKIADAMNEKYKDKGYILLPRIGIHYGKMILGTIGEENRLDDTVISDTVNTASRIASVCEKLDKKIIISHSLQERLNLGNTPDILLNQLDSISVKGKEKPLELYECLTGDSK